ncbi:MAG: 16S rRNA (adenine(1518)-N(6)/adenine(1519)-N(6))-dimethyltransferase RsmA [bacterium]
MPITHAFLKELGLLPHKSMGQHLLKDEADAEAIIDALDIQPGDQILEIGAGCGVLTERILERFGTEDKSVLVSVEIDNRYVDFLKKRFSNNKHFRVLKQDILNVNLSGLFDGSFKVVGNIPYYISSPILRLLFNSHGFISDIVIMLQKEVGMRVVSGPSDEYFGLLSIMRMLHYNASVVKDIDKTHFIPQPKVDSVVLKLQVHTPLVNASDEKLLLRILKYAFSARRKMLKNTLQPLGSKSDILKWCEDAGININDRAENIGIDTWIKFLNVYKKSLYSSTTAYDGK